MTSENVVSVRLDGDTLAWLDSKCASAKLKRSDFLKHIIQQAKDAALSPQPHEDPLADLRRQHDPVRSLMERTLKVLERAKMVTLGDGGEGPIYVQKTSKILMDDIDALIRNLPEHRDILRAMYAALSQLIAIDLSDPANSSAVAKLKAQLQEAHA